MQTTVIAFHQVLSKVVIQIYRKFLNLLSDFKIYKNFFLSVKKIFKLFVIAFFYFIKNIIYFFIDSLNITFIFNTKIEKIYTLDKYKQIFIFSQQLNPIEYFKYLSTIKSQKSNVFWSKKCLILSIFKLELNVRPSILLP